MTCFGGNWINFNLALFAARRFPIYIAEVISLIARSLVHNENIIYNVCLDANVSEYVGVWDYSKGILNRLMLLFLLTRSVYFKLIILSKLSLRSRSQKLNLYSLSIRVVFWFPNHPQS